MDRISGRAARNTKRSGKSKWFGPRCLSEGRVPARENLLMPVRREAAMLLHALAVGTAAKHVLDVGTSYGYPALWLADAMRTTGGRVTSIDLPGEVRLLREVVSGAPD